MVKERKKKSQQLVNTLVDFLEEQNEEDLITQVARDFERLSSRRGEKGDTIVATSAVKLSDANKRNIQKFFKGILRKQYPVKNVVDETTIGGIKLEWGDLLLDLTLSSRLNLLRRQLRA